LRELYFSVVLAAAMAPACVAQAQSEPAKPEAKPASPPAKPATVKEVTVTATTTDTRVSIDRRSYDVSKDLGAVSGSISDALRNVPSVEVDVNGKVSIRGDGNVTILVDGKPSGQFKGGSASQALQQMPASEIERVEVITNPTAEFSPDGSGGILNLVTKKTHKAGRSGGARINLGSNGGWNGGVNGAWRGEKLTVSGDLNYSHNTQRGSFNGDTEGKDPSGQAFSQHSQGGNTGTSDWRGAHANVEYDLTPKDRVSAEVYAGGGVYASHGVLDFAYDGPTGAPITAYEQLTQSHSQFSYLGAMETWRHTFAGDQHDLVVSLDTDLNRNHNDNDWTQTDSVPAPLVSAEAQTRLEHNGETELKADYQSPMPHGGKLKLGLLASLTDTTLDNSDRRGPSLGALVPVPALSDLFKVDQALEALYVTYEQPLGALTVLGGLRAENTHLHLNDVTGGQTEGRDYFRVYPSLHLAWKLNDEQQLTASWAQRIQRPSASDLNPFRVINSPFSGFQGNPDLVPQHTQSFEAGWQYRKGPTIYLATLYWRVSTNGVTDVQTDLGNGFILSTRENLAESRNGGMELVASGKITKTLSYNLSADAHWNQIDASTLGFSGERAAWSASGRGSLNWQATPGDLFQLNGNLSGKTLTPQGFRDPGGRVNFGYRHKVNDSFALVLTGQDVFATARYGQTLDTAILSRRSESTPRSRVFYLGLVYTFGMGAKKDQGFDYGGGGGGPTP
jgi:outer membrane receptor protein involved in Fe transport